jgi:hypothetical protein
MNQDRLIGIAYVATSWHSGQWSRGYRLLSRIRWNPGTDDAARLLPRDEWAEARAWAAHYTRRARKEARLF